MSDWREEEDEGEAGGGANERGSFSKALTLISP
jgi:hypothetical protein